MEVSGQLHAPAALPPGQETTVPIWQEVVWASDPVWPRWWEKFPIMAPAGNWTPVVQPVASFLPYTDRTIAFYHIILSF